MTDQELFDVIITHWRAAYKEMPAGVYETDVSMILEKEGLQPDTPAALMAFGFVAGMHHGLTAAAAIEQNAPSYPADKVEPQTWHPLET